MPMLEQPAQPAKARGLRIDWRALAASRWLWCLGAVLIIAALELAQGFASLSTFLGDTDDATRLYEIRQLMATGAWFDMTLPRIGGPTPLISHWSRLIDVPLILLLQVFGRFASPPNAELAVRIMWPLLVLFVFLRILVRAAECQGGRTAAILLLCLSLTCLTGLYQFHIGRIDHHNGMIMGSVGGMLLLLDARRNPREGTLAGVMIGIGLAIGYEPLAFVLPVLGVAALMESSILIGCPACARWLSRWRRRWR